jgi:hypothetical protein
VDLTAVTVLGIENVPVLPLAPQYAPHELQDRIAFANEVLRLNSLESEQSAPAHAETDGADAPVVNTIDLGADLASRRRADVDHALRPDLVGSHLQDLRPAIEFLHEGENFIFLYGDHAGHALGRPHHQNIPYIPGEIIVQIVQLVHRELIAEHVLLADPFEHLALGALTQDLVAEDAVRHRLHAFEIA